MAAGLDVFVEVLRLQEAEVARAVEVFCPQEVAVASCLSPLVSACAVYLSPQKGYDSSLYLQGASCASDLQATANSVVEEAGRV